jgi:hypothetical protein
MRLAGALTAIKIKRDIVPLRLFLSRENFSKTHKNKIIMLCCMSSTTKALILDPTPF